MVLAGFTDPDRVLHLSPGDGDVPSGATMTDSREDAAARPDTVGHRLRQARQRWFLGRDGELDLFRTALGAPQPPFTVLHVHGPGGVGKTALLRAFADEARTAGAVTVPLDARQFEPSPPGFTAAVRAAAGLEDDEDPGVALGALGRRTVMLLDTYETAAPLDDWLRERFLPELPADSMMVLAGREPPTPAWRSEGGWRELLRVIALRNLGPDVSRAYLRAAGVPERLHERVLAFTHGHPLALSLVVDVLAQEKWQGPGGLQARAPDVVGELLARFVLGVPSELHRRALEVCALARLTTEALLRAALDADEVHDVFEWLRSLSFIEQGPYDRVPEADFEVGGRRLATFAHDWRRMPAEQWLGLMGRRALDVEFQPAAAAPGGQARPLALSQAQFDQAVRRALHDLHRADLLAANPLLRSRVVRERADAQGTPPVPALAALLREAAALLAADPRDDKLLRAVDRTYLRPATTQERSAELLGLPFSTYRRHLTQGVARIVASLWERELYGIGPGTGEQEPSSDRSGN
jgi:AAA ATPase domain